MPNILTDSTNNLNRDSIFSDIGSFLIHGFLSSFQAAAFIGFAVVLDMFTRWRLPKSRATSAAIRFPFDLVS
jgi:hypothetical protein